MQYGEFLMKIGAHKAGKISDGDIVDAVDAFKASISGWSDADMEECFTAGVNTSRSVKAGLYSFDNFLKDKKLLTLK